MNKVTITSVEFQKGFGRYREAALKQPVTITNHGRESLVLMSADEYKRLKSLDRQPLYAWELGEEALRALETAETQAEASAFDSEIAG